MNKQIDMNGTPETNNERTLKIALEVFTELAKTLKQERDEARELAKEADFGHDAAILDLEKCEAAANLMAERAKELITRWDQPSWKDTAPTARYINALRIAVRAYENAK
jgi:hypothetical protein